MPNPRSRNPDWQQRLKEELARNKKQTALLTVLLVVGLFVGVRMLKKKPSSASAAPSTVTALAGHGGQGAPTGAPMLPGSRDPIGDSERDTYIRSINRDITRDLFEFQTHLYPLIKPPEPELDGSPETVDGLPVPAIEEHVRARSARLALQSTIDSDAPIAVINGQVLVLGDVVDGFTVVEIGIGLCVVEQAGVQVRLEMDED